jgi:predicted permease
MPDWKNLVRLRLAALNLTTATESDLAEELAQHLEDCYRDLTAAGATPEDAYRQVIAQLDSVHPLRNAVRSERRLPRYDAVPAGDGRPGSFLDGLWRDFRYALRSMRKSPVFITFVVLTLALGIGANTTVFTVLNTLILNPLPARNPAELAGIAGAEADASKAGTPFPISYPDLQDYQAQNAVFDSLAGYTSPRVLTHQEGGASEVLFAELVTGNYFRTLGLAPSAGRFFLPEEDARTLGLAPSAGRFFLPEEDAPGGPAVAVINYATWQTRFGGAPDIVGRSVRLNDVVFTVIGVAPRSFIGVNAIFGPDFWLPAATAGRVWPAQMRNALRERGQAAFLAVGRYRPHITRAQAQADIATIASALAREYPATDDGHTATVRPIRDAVLANAGGGTSGQIIFAGAALLIVVGIVLLIACSNVANLLLARSAARRQEIAIRLAIGASRARLIRQFLTESVLMGLLGGAAGLLVGYAGLRLLFGVLPGSANFAAPRFDGLVFGYALLLSLATGFLFGTAPALRASRANFAEALKESGRTVGRNRRGISLSNALLVGQVAFSFLLLVTAALFLRSIGRAYEMDPGFQTAHLAVFSTNAGQAGYTRAQTKSFYKEVRDRVAGMPGITSSAWSANMPLWARAINGLQVEGRQQRSKTDTIRAIVNTVDPAYFDTAGVAIRAGRGFTELDRDISAPVAIVNETMAREFWPGGALGRRIQLPGETQFRQIVGVARTANYTGWGEPPQFCVYVPLEQNYSDAMALYVRTKGDPLQQITPVEREIHAAGPQIVVTMPRTGRQIIDGGLFSARMGVVMLSVFGLLALGLASIGLYGILAYAATRRQREIGLRMALGASRISVFRLMLGHGMSLVLVGVGIGFAASLATGRVLSRILYGVSGTDPLSLGAAAAVLTAVALVACYLPARRATRVDPLTALREV